MADNVAKYKTPGVYIAEQGAFSNSVVAVATALPVFLGYTEKAPAGGASIAGAPVVSAPARVTSLAEFEAVFGGGARGRFVFAGPDVVSVEAGTRFLLYDSMRLFFANGGGMCWVVSVGSYVAAGRTKDEFLAGLKALESMTEMTMIVAPDAVLLSADDWQAVAEASLTQCGKLQDRVAILDVYDGYKARTSGADDVIAGFRSRVSGECLKYGVAYFPWLQASVVEAGEVDFRLITEASLGEFARALKEEIGPDAAKAGLRGLVDGMAGAEAAAVAGIHSGLMAGSALYARVCAAMLAALNLLPPSGAMAGVYTAVDNSEGVWRAPANVSLNAVVSPAVALTDMEQEDLNVPLDGKAVNAIRSFAGRGTLVWGARTLDGNSQDWKYISVRRFTIMLEQSLKLAARAYVFEPNTANTWMTVKSMIENFLTGMWKQGALQGSKPQDAFGVEVGLGSTMTADDILNGILNITVMVAPLHPAEFLIIVLQQQMQKS